ncbi:arginine decarboxylase [Striga asiatica]|uniref:Arginine decarboxylase n=1 Tax=Striga asiatica TaxID=4170 RepID=A0A5A7PUD2_STRAF|nr:arginine decarboxylase [Striga asiatica]
MSSSLRTALRKPKVETDRNNNLAVKTTHAIKSKPAALSSIDLPPLVATLKASSERKAVAFHFPGHKRGEAAPSALTDLIGPHPFFHDVTEIPELDMFFSPKGPLLDAKNLAADLFGAKETWFLVGGTSCGVQAAVMATCSPDDTIVLPRNAHVSATTGVILSGAIPKYIVPQRSLDWDIAAGITPWQARFFAVEIAIKESKMEGRKLAAVFVTSPTYNGICSDVAGISKICRSERIPLIIDEAHGAHFKFHPEMPKTALEQGADISIQSTHKVLCSLSQSSMLHISGDNKVDRERLHKCLHSLQMTSPNWLLLASLDSARHQLSANPDTIFDKTVELAKEAKTAIGKIPGVSILDIKDFADFPDLDPLRITIGVWRLGISGFQAKEVLDDELGIVPEFVSTNSVTLAFSLGTMSEHVERLVSGLKSLSKRFFSETNEKLDNKIHASFARKSMPIDSPVMRLSPR